MSGLDDPNGLGAAPRTLSVLREVYSNLNHQGAPAPPPAAANYGRNQLATHLAAKVFELGLRQASPKVIKALLAGEGGALTTEHIKSHLQKFRLHKERSTDKFLEHYRQELQPDWDALPTAPAAPVEEPARAAPDEDASPARLEHCQRQQEGLLDDQARLLREVQGLLDEFRRQAGSSPEAPADV